MVERGVMPYDVFIRRYDKQRVGRWGTEVGGSREVIVSVGRFETGEWWVETTAGQHVEVYSGDRAECAARKRVKQLRAEGEWQPLPVDYGSDGGQPRYGADTDGLQV